MDQFLDRFRRNLAGLLLTKEDAPCFGRPLQLLCSQVEAPMSEMADPLRPLEEITAAFQLGLDRFSACNIDPRGNEVLDLARLLVENRVDHEVDCQTLAPMGRDRRVEPYRLALRGAGHGVLDTSGALGIAGEP